MEITPEQTRRLYGCRSSLRHVPVGANASRPPAEQRMGFLCRDSTHLSVTRIWCRTPSGLAARQLYSPAVSPQRIRTRTAIASALGPFTLALQMAEDQDLLVLNFDCVA